MKGKWKTDFTAGLLAVLGLLWLTACGSSVPSKKQMAEDLSEDVRTIYIYDNYEETPLVLDVTDITIEKRQTNEKDDTVYCTVTMENENYRYIADYILFYNYYDEGGWILDNCCTDPEGTAGMEIIPLNGLPEKTANAEMDCYYFDSCSLTDQSFDAYEDGSAEICGSSFTYDVSYTNTYGSYNGTVSLNYYFYSEGTYGYWTYDALTYNDSFQWDVTGTWETESTNELNNHTSYLNNDTVSMELDSIDLENYMVTASVSNSYEDSIVWFADEGPKMVEHGTDGMVSESFYFDYGYNPSYTSEDDFDDYFDHTTQYEPPCLKFSIRVPNWTTYHISMRPDHAGCQSAFTQYIMQRT